MVEEGAVLRFNEKPSDLRTTALCFLFPSLVSSSLFLCLKISLERIDNEVLKREITWKKRN
jgi:hypothetical protein